METTLAEVVSGLQFRPLTQNEEETISEILGLAIGEWMMTEGDYTPETKLSAKDVRRTLKRVAGQLDEITGVLSAASEGLSHVHDIEVMKQLAAALALRPDVGSISKAYEAIERFTGEAVQLADTARVASKLVEGVGSRPGPKRQIWHQLFADAVAYVCALNGVRPKIVVDRINGRPGGRFFAAATAFERLLPPRMRAPSDAALAKRLTRSKTTPRRKS
jgi:hypothetical protein